MTHTVRGKGGCNNGLMINSSIEKRETGWVPCTHHWIAPVSLQYAMYQHHLVVEETWPEYSPCIGVSKQFVPSVAHDNGAKTGNGELVTKNEVHEARKLGCTNVETKLLEYGVDNFAVPGCTGFIDMHSRKRVDLGTVQGDLVIGGWQDLVNIRTEPCEEVRAVHNDMKKQVLKRLGKELHLLIGVQDVSYSEWGCLVNGLQERRGLQVLGLCIIEREYCGACSIFL